MATLTDLMPSIYSSLNTVSRERIGAVAASTINADENERAAVGQTINYPIVEQGSLDNITPGMTAPAPQETDAAYGEIAITNAKAYSIKWTSEQRKAFANGDKAQGGDIMRQQFEQGFRTIANAIEADLCGAAYKGASRAVGTAGTTPFNSTDDLGQLATLKEVLDNNGASTLNRHVVLNSSAVTNLLSKQKMVVKVNEAGDNTALRRGIFDDIFGFAIHQSGGVASHTKGTGTGYLIDNASGYDAGSTTLKLKTGSDNILAGDVVTFAADTVNKYVVGVGASAPGDIVLNRPGNLVTLPNSNAMTIGDSFKANFACVQSALHLVIRPPAGDGDMAVDATVVFDEVSGLMFEIREYEGYRQNRYEIAAAWGTKAVKSEDIVILLG